MRQLVSDSATVMIVLVCNTVTMVLCVLPQLPCVTLSLPCTALIEMSVSNTTRPHTQPDTVATVQVLRQQFFVYSMGSHP